MYRGAWFVSEGVGSFPAILYLHSGAWFQGTQTEFQRQAAHMATKGFVGATIQYRLIPEAYFPAQVQDSKAAVRWLRAKASTYRIDTDYDRLLERLSIEGLSEQ